VCATVGLECAAGVWEWCGVLRVLLWLVCTCVGCNAVYDGMCWCLVVISLEDNGIGDEGAAAIGVGLHDVPSLTSLKYVMQVWVMRVMGLDRRSGVVRRGL
jgi:hypothetical protein